ncbi:MAG: (2Fe-2S) ferredoxin domain-containing protein, partial [Candidatus Thorarchaeota archaeon]
MVDSDTIEVLVCLGTGCESAKGDLLYNQLIRQTKEKKLDKKVKVKRIGCHGLCQEGAVLAIEPKGFFYCQVQESDIEEIVQSHFIEDQPVERLFFKTPEGERIPL